MHYQVPPQGEEKLIRCTRGAFYDVLLDLRTDSPGYRQWRHFRLTAGNCCMLYVPEGIAHGFQTLEDNTEVFYQISQHYAPEAARGVRWNDPAFAIQWPSCADRILSARDRGYADFQA
jgi:dTDP-4-dehydrorhamnose 3,5-epimerase